MTLLQREQRSMAVRQALREAVTALRGQAFVLKDLDRDEWAEKIWSMAAAVEEMSAMEEVTLQAAYCNAEAV